MLCMCVASRSHTMHQRYAHHTSDTMGATVYSGLSRNLAAWNGM